MSGIVGPEPEVDHMHGSVSSATTQASAGWCPPGGTGSRTRTAQPCWPRAFDPIGEALLGGWPATAAGAVVGRFEALEGTSLGEVLSGLALTYRLAGHGEPEWEVTQSVVLAWNEAHLATLLSVTCDDPLTGLAGPAHLRSRLRDLVELGLTAEHAFVVVRLAEDLTTPRLLRLSMAAEALRSCFTGAESWTHAGHETIAGIARRGHGLDTATRASREVLEDLGLPGARIWVESVPSVYDLAAQCLADLAVR